MKAVLFPIAFLAAAVSAQTTSACAADYIVEACLGTSNGQLATCGTNDYQCKCDAYKQGVQCFDNCPNDPRVNDYKSQQTVWCGLATQYPSSTSTPISRAVSTTSVAAATTTDTTASTTASGSGSNAPSSTGSATGSASPTKATNSAADLLINAGGVLGAVAAVVAAVL